MEMTAILKEAMWELSQSVANDMDTGSDDPKIVAGMTLDCLEGHGYTKAQEEASKLIGEHSYFAVLDALAEHVVSL